LPAVSASNHIVAYKPRPIEGKGSQLDDIAADRGNRTGTLQHSQVLNAAGQVQCDILVLRSDLGHHEIRDNVMDDAIDSIGQRAAGSDKFALIDVQAPDLDRPVILGERGEDRFGRMKYHACGPHSRCRVGTAGDKLPRIRPVEIHGAVDGPRSE
jgi:hypothetical protein